VEVGMIAMKEFHGNLRPPAAGIRIDDPADKNKKITVPAGGAEHMATLVKQLRADHKNTIFVAAGDLIGASPFLSAMFHDEPTIEALSMMGLEVASVGNHEFDEGKEELLRMQNGGCHPTDGCQGPHPFPGARFHYLAASTFDNTTGKTVFPPYEIREFDGIPIASSALLRGGDPEAERELLTMFVQSARRLDIVRDSQRNSKPFAEIFDIRERPLHAVIALGESDDLETIPELGTHLAGAFLHDERA